MASQTIKSSSVVFLDTTDDRKLEVYISSNLPQVQIFNPNTSSNQYSPDWASTPLKLKPEVFLDSKKITGATINWSKKIGSTTSTITSDTAELIVSSNEMKGDIAIVTYICDVEYQNLTARSQITFNRSITGLNGTNGKDGTSVTILGSYDTLEALQAAHPTGSIGDSYIVAGDLYVWSIDDSSWKEVGQIQGPKGKDGESAKSIILSANAQVFKIGKSSEHTIPTDIIIEPQFINIDDTTLTWEYSTDGTNFNPTAAGVSRTDNTVTINGDTMDSSFIIVRASNGTYSDIYTVYKVFDGIDGKEGKIGASAPIAFLTNENITFSADAQGRISGNTVVSNVVAYKGAEKVLPEISSIEGIPEDYVRAYGFDENITYYVYPEDNLTEIIEANPQPTAENFKDGQYYIKSMSIATENTASNEVKLSISIADGATLGSPNSIYGEISIYIREPVVTTLHLGWSKINTGANGAKGSDAVTFQIYSENGYVLSKEVPNITLRTFAYDGSKQIETGAIYRWYKRIDDAWVQIDDAIDDNFSISHYDVDFNCSYMCKMIYNGTEYFSVVTIDDKNDTNTVFTSKPESYMAGDIWIVGSDYQPGQIEIGTILRAEHTNSQYNNSDWVTATKYDEQLKDLKEDMDNYNQYFSFNSEQGLIISAKDKDGNPSRFSSTLSNDKLALNEENEAVAWISSRKMHITEAEIESPLTVTGKYSGATMLQAPIINLGTFSLVVESNGSLSIISNL